MYIPNFNIKNTLFANIEHFVQTKIQKLTKLLKIIESSKNEKS